MNGIESTGLASQLSLLQKRLAALSEENDLLLSQLNRMLDESQPAAREPEGGQPDVAHSERALLQLLLRWWLACQPDQLELDLRDVVCGDNWYHAEPDGRWAGPATRSLIRLPALRPGRYACSLEIVDAMDEALLRQTEVRVDGQETPVQLQFDGSYPATLSFEVRRDAAGPDSIDVELVFPYVLSPWDRGVPDDRFLAVRARMLRIKYEG
jgi:hypothetical protein